MQRDGSGELFLDLSCGLSGDGTWIHRIGYQAVCVIEEDPVRISGQIFWPADLRASGHDTPASLNGVLHVRSGRMKTVTPPDSPLGSFGTTVWEAFQNGTITSINARLDGWVATYEITKLPALLPITVIVDVLAPFAPGRTNIGAFRDGGPDPVVLNGNVAEVDGVNFRLGEQGVR